MGVRCCLLREASLPSAPVLEVPAAELVRPRRRPLGFELVLVAIVSLAVLVPGIWKYSLVDPWETHYGEVGRRMLQDHDWVHTDWQNEGFRSKPVLTFWMMAASMKAVGLADDGGYSGEMEHDARTMVAIRLPFICCAVLGLMVMWWMLARLISRRLAWLALLVVGSTPFFCLIARQGIPDMPLTACVIGAISMFIMAMEDGDEPLSPVWRLRLPGHRLLALDARHGLFIVVGGFVVLQAVYYAVYFTLSPRLALMYPLNPAVVLPLMMFGSLFALWRDGWLVVRLPFIALGGVIAALRKRELPEIDLTATRWRRIIDGYLVPWERDSIDRYVVRGLVFPIAWANGDGWAKTDAIADHVLRMAPITTTRQVYMLWCYAILGVSVLAKGPPGLTVVAGVGFFYVLLFNKWRSLYDGAFELKRGLIVLVVVAFPWHFAMYLKDGAQFVDEYLFTHILNRAAADPDKSLGTFEYYTSQIGHGMWLWAALLPVALARGLTAARTDTREGRVRSIVGLWAICGFAVFALVQTKFHHYVLPAVPALGILVAFFLDDLWTGRARLHPVYAAIAIAIVVLICRDLMWEPERWIEMFVFRYDRPWPAGEPYVIDVSDGILALGLCAVGALLIAALPWRRFAVVLLSASGLAICVWSLQVYMPIAGKHWGMRDAIHAYYQQRTVYGEKIVYFGAGELADEWSDVTDQWSFDTFIPDNLQIGQPMTIKVDLNKAAEQDERVMEQEVEMVGAVSAIGDHSVTVALPKAERAKLQPLVARGVAKALRGRPPVHEVEADRLIAWQLYWRGENFWSGDEIWGWLPEQHTALMKTDNVEFLKYLNDRHISPLGHRVFLISEAGRAQSVKSMLPTQRARDSFEVIDTTSNKFAIVAFYL